MKNKNTRRGFTLIELLVVVLIIGILAAVAVPQYQKAVLKTKTTEGLNYLDALIKAQQVYYLANGEYTTDLSKLDIDLTIYDSPNLYLIEPKQEWQVWKIKITNKLQVQWTTPTGPATAEAGKRMCWAKKEAKQENEICKSLGKYQGYNGDWNMYNLD